MLPIKDFNLQCFIDAINELARSDEIERALWLCDNLPAYYRDHRPQEITDLKNKIISRISTAVRYSEDPGHLKELRTNGFFINGEMTLRGTLIKKDVAWFNKQGIIPHVVDLGPGNFWVPAMLHYHKYQFTYQPLGVHPECLKEAREVLKFNENKIEWSPVIFLACEIIEHLWNEQEIKSNMLHYVGWPDIAHISTPKYTFGFNLGKDWYNQTDELGHLRAYTPSDFQKVVINMFGVNYQPCFYDSVVMHLRMLKRDSKFDLELEPNIEKEMELVYKWEQEVAKL